MPTVKPPMRVFIATVADGERVDGTDVRVPRAHRVDAAYYQHDGVFTTFKDAANQAVFTVQSNYLISVARVGDDTETAVFRELLAEADRHGHAQGRITTSETDPDGRVYEHGYDIQVAKLAAVGITKET